MLDPNAAASLDARRDRRGVRRAARGARARRCRRASDDRHRATRSPRSRTSGRRRRRWRRPPTCSATGGVAVIGCGTSYHVGAGPGRAARRRDRRLPRLRGPARAARTTGCWPSRRSATTTEIVDAFARAPAAAERVAVVGVPGLAVGRGGGPGDRAGLRRRVVGGADPVRHQRRGPRARVPGRGPGAGDRRRAGAPWPRRCRSTRRPSSCTRSWRPAGGSGWRSRPR